MGGLPEFIIGPDEGRPRWLILLCHKFHLWLLGRRRRQHGHRERAFAIAKASARWIVAIELGTWRCGRSRWRLGVGNHWEREIFGLEWRNVVLRGESSPVRRSGNRRLRLRVCRDGGNRASRGPHNAQGRFPVSGPHSRARYASASWRDRPGPR